MSTESRPGLPGLLNTICPHYINREEARLVCRQFRSGSWSRNRQVLWSGMHRGKAQMWADNHGYQTLTTALGPLVSLEKSKKKKKRSKFMKGASALFSWFISQGECVTLLLPPPPNRLHPSGLTSLQDFEIPIVMGLLQGGAVEKVLVFHPDATTEEAKTSAYQVWPRNETEKWVAQFGFVQKVYSWRAVKKGAGMSAVNLIEGEGILESKLTQRPTRNTRSGIRPAGKFLRQVSGYCK